MLMKKFINRDGDIIDDNLSDFYEQYPQVISNLEANKVIDGNKKKNYVRIRKDNFSKIRNLWDKVNQKYYLKFEDIPNDDLSYAFYEILKGDIYRDTIIATESKRTEIENDRVVMKEKVANYFVSSDKLPYKDFLSQINKRTGLSIRLIHENLCKFYKENDGIDERVFSKVAVKLIVDEFNKWLDEKLLKK